MPANYKFYERIIPKFIPNRIVLSAFSTISFLTGPIKKRIRELHFEENCKILKERGEKLLKDTGFIENQAEWEGVIFGSHKKSDMSYSGCGIIATYNALMGLGDKSATMPYLISYFERNGIALKGGFGISPSAFHKFFRNRGYEVKKLTTRNREAYRRLGKEYSSFIVTFYWNAENIKEHLHTVNISKEPDGFYIHNNYCRGEGGSYKSQGPYRSLDEAVYNLGPKAATMVIIAIRSRKNK